MVIGVLQVELVVDGSTSLKDKRRVVKSLKDRLHREHQVSVAEVGMQDSMTTAVLGIVMAASDVKYAQGAMDKLVDKIMAGRGYYVQDHNLELLTGQ
ncbi:hypothetical protein KS4_09760 [Poriferisphaera corsica]|uniref:DUF503 domain-containing protein n=1 Tax=Poriferisphaera corsica TaxID=2528020 RepID=A0A517YRT3_9BACT|nr:hypothetical protein KS4_09760 [Poriferisphaera corsica]